MKIAVLEKTNFTIEQLEELKTVGEVDFYEQLTQEEANDIAVKYDIVIVNWIDPTPFILNMKSGSLVSLLSTGYGWIYNLEEASKKGVYVSNIPNYSTEAVAEHLLGMLLGVSKNIFATINTKDNNKIGFELKNKTVGIIGLGNIGNRFAEIMNFFGANLITYNRTKKLNRIVKDVTLDYLLNNSDIICITCAVNDESRNLINMNNINYIKKGTVIIGSTWGVIEENAILELIDNDIIESLSFDAAVEGKETVSKMVSEHSDKLFLTPHIAYNTVESEKRQLDICVKNIVDFVNGKKTNIIN